MKRPENILFRDCIHEFPIGRQTKITYYVPEPVVSRLNSWEWQCIRSYCRVHHCLIQPMTTHKEMKMILRWMTLLDISHQSCFYLLGHVCFLVLLASYYVVIMLILNLVI